MNAKDLSDMVRQFGEIARKGDPAIAVSGDGAFAIAASIAAVAEQFARSREEEAAREDQRMEDYVNTQEREASIEWILGELKNIHGLGEGCEMADQLNALMVKIAAGHKPD